MKKIAIVDDNEDLLFTIKYGISKEKTDLDIITFNTPDEFIEATKKQKFDLLILDIMMPGKNGWDTFSEIKEAGNMNNKTPLVFLTAKTDDQSKRLGMMGADGYLTKPFEIAELITKINEKIN